MRYITNFIFLMISGTVPVIKSQNNLVFRALIRTFVTKLKLKDIIMNMKIRFLSSVMLSLLCSWGAAQ